MYDFKNTALQQEKITTNFIDLGLDVMEIEYNYYDKELNDYNHRKCCVIARDEKDAISTIARSIPGLVMAI